MAAKKNAIVALVTIIGKIQQDRSLKITDKSSSRRTFFEVKSPDRIATASMVQEELDSARVKYASKPMPGSSFPSTVITTQIDGKTRTAIIQYKPSAGAGKADARTTFMQEKASTYVFERVLKDNKTWPSVEAMYNDAETMEGIRNVYPNVQPEWMEVFWKQHVTMFNEFSKNTWKVFDHSGSGSFMDYVTELVNKKFGITKKDNWDPADMWLIQSSVKKITDAIDATVEGSRGTQTIQELNAVMREMYKKRILVGVSLKKVSGKQAKWEEFNVKELTLEEKDDYNFPDVESTIRLDEKMSQDTVVKLTKSGKGYKFQIKGNNSTGFSNLKWEATQIGAGAARGGKAQVDMVVRLLKDNGQNFDKSNGDYPKNLEEYQKKEKIYTDMFKRVKDKVDTRIDNDDEFNENIKAKFITEPHVANSKLMQLAFLDSIYSIKPPKKQSEVWTDMVFLAIKKGNKFGPFGKLY